MSIHPRHAGGCHAEFNSVVTYRAIFVLPDIKCDKGDAPRQIISRIGLWEKKVCTNKIISWKQGPSILNQCRIHGNNRRVIAAERQVSNIYEDPSDVGSAPPPPPTRDSIDSDDSDGLGVVEDDWEKRKRDTKKKRAKQGGLKFVAREELGQGGESDGSGGQGGRKGQNQNTNLTFHDWPPKQSIDFLFP